MIEAVEKATIAAYLISANLNQFSEDNEDRTTVIN